MSTFSGYHISQFNQKARTLVGDGKMLMSNKEIRDLQAEILELMVVLRKHEATIQDLRKQIDDIGVVEIELVGDTFKK